MANHKPSYEELEQRIKELENSEALYHDLIETSQDLIWQCDTECRFVYLNAAWQNVFGYTIDEMLGKKFTNFQSQEQAQLDSKEFERLLYGNTVIGLETIYLDKNGKEIHLVFNAKYLTDKEGKITGARGTAYDITERKLAETSLRESEKLYRQMNENSPLGMHFYKLNHNNQLVFVGANPAANQLLKVDHSIFIGKTIEEAFPPLTDTEVPDRYRNAAKDGSTWSTEQIFYDDTHITGAFEVLAFQTSPGNMVAIFADITKRKQTEETLKERNQFIESLINLSPDILYIYDIIERKNVYSNEGLQKILGYSFAEIQEMGNQIIPLLMHPDDLTEYIENIIPLYAKTRDNEHISHQYRMKDNTGIWHWIESTEIIYKRKDGIPQQIFGAARDVTERKKAEEIICQQNRELQELNATKDKFFSIIAHDLRSPFSSLLGFSDLLLKNPDEYNKEGIIRIVNQINNISDQTFKLLENLLNWSKLQTGAMIPQPKECNFKDLVYDVFQLNTEIAKGKNITLRNLVGNIIVNCDPEMTKTILRNLISNALKFTNNNGVVSIEATQRDSFVEIQISDTGVGIPSELIAHLFRIDTTFSTIGTANELGTGLGLHLCKELIEKQGGKIWVKSEIGKGSEFHITIPITH